MKKWKCSVCGYMHEGQEAPESCPVCRAARNKFTLMAEETSPEDPSRTGERKEAPLIGPQKKWRCTVCGYIHTGSSPPDKCPVCGADRSKFVPIDQEKMPKEPRPATMGRSGSDRPVASSGKPLQKRFDDFATRVGKIIPAQHYWAKLLTKYHGHPIVVHIPNGVLPIAILFTFLAGIFNSNALAVAARYNMLFTLVSMPAVIFTGLVDWVNQFKGRMTKVFRVKMVCALIVSFTSLLLTVWWFVQPDVYLNRSSGAFLFVSLNMADLIAAVIAGWYGGKLMFRRP